MRVRPWMLVSAAWIAPAILGGVNEVVQGRLWRGTVDLGAAAFAAADWMIYALLTPGVFALARRWPLARPELRRHALYHLAAALGFCVLWAASGTLLKLVLVPEEVRDVPSALASWIFITLPFGVAVYLALVGIEHAIYYFVTARQREAQLATARLASLTAKLNPHFLFNAMNTVAVLVRDADPAAVRVVEQLAELMRQTLDPARGDEVSLAVELELVEGYLAIERARYSDRLRPVLELDPALRSARVPSFALQHLAENAVRHGIARRTEAGLVEIRARRDGDRLELTVRDDGPGIADGAEPVPGHGLANTRERLRVLYGDRATLVVERHPDGGTIATLRLPLHTPEPADAR
ncbi:MAG TPA: histidine kinase [Kofleriaceae bacterium]|nr:histidine kinase [Kofleriaceae bacterium]